MLILAATNDTSMLRVDIVVVVVVFLSQSGARGECALTEEAVKGFLDSLVSARGLILDESGAVLDHLAELVSALYSRTRNRLE